MRILVVCSDADIGGAERFLVSLAAARRTEDRMALVVLMQPGTLSAQLEAAFDEVEYLGFPATSRNLPGMVAALSRAVRAFQPDVVSSHLFHADLVTALARIKAPRTSTVHTQHLGPEDHPLTRLIARAVGLLSFRFAAVIPASSSAQMAEFITSLRMRHVVPAIPNAADVPDTPRFDPSSRRFLSLARNHPVKGHRRLFQAFAEIANDFPEWELVAHGPGVAPDDPSMRTAVEEAGASHLLANGRIRLAGPTDRPEETLAEASALVISSVYGEAFPIVGAEAAGLGVPVITTDLGSCAEFADDPRYLVPPDNASALAGAMRRYAAAGDAERSRLSALARARAEAAYDPRIAYERYRAVFASLLPGGTSKR